MFITKYYPLHYTLHKSQVLFWVCVTFLASIAGVDFLYCSIAYIFVIAAYRSIYKQSITLTVAIGLLTACGLAWWFGQYRLHQYPIDTSTIPYGEEFSIEAVVSQPPKFDRAQQKLYVRTSDIPGKIYIKTGRFPEYTYGEVLQITCMLQQPEPIEDFAFDRYLARYGAYSICLRPNITSTHSFRRNFVLQYLYSIRQWVRQEIKTIWPEPVASLLLGVILGIQDDIPDDIVEQFRITGTIHILVVSGMHVMIIAQLLSRIGLHWFPRKQLFWLILLTLSGFCIITGLAASVVRATIMGVLPILARTYGRQPTMHYSLAVVAALMVAWNPYILLYDVGFQLSFLATIGLIYFQPLTTQICWWLPERFGVRETMSTTLAATIPTTPLIMQIFGTVSLVSPLANLVVVPVSTFMLFAGSGIIVVQQVLPTLGHYWAYLVWQVVRVTLTIVEWLSQWTYALIDGLVVPNWFVIISYSIIGLYIVWSVRKRLSWS